MWVLLAAWIAAAEEPCAGLASVDEVLQRRCLRTLRASAPLGGEVQDLVRAAVAGAPAPADLRAPDEAIVLRVLTYNVGLLWFFGGYSVPGGDERRARVASRLAALLAAPDGPDVVLLQEIYRDEDLDLVRDAVAPWAVLLDARPDPKAWTGLALIVRRARLAEPAPAPAFLPLQPDAFAQAGFVRGVLWSDLALADGATVRVGNVHLSPMSRADLSWRRTQQTLELVDALTDPTAGWACDGCARVLGGDFNLGPDWDWAHTPEATSWDPARLRLAERWLTWDAVLYALLAGAAHGPPADTGASLAADNPLWQGYRWARGEPSRRVDHVFVHGGVVLDARVTLDEPHDGLVLSDHYGVLAEVAVPR